MQGIYLFPIEDQQKYKHLIVMIDKLNKIIKKFNIRKTAKIKNSNEYKKININSFSIKEKLRQAKVLAMLAKKNLIEKLEDSKEYQANELDEFENKPKKSNIATVDKKLINQYNQTDIKNI